MNPNLDKIIAYYRRQGAPADQTALVSLLREVQQESGGAIPRSCLASIADSCGTKERFLLALIRRFPSLRLADTHTLELCAGPNCTRRASLAVFAERIRASNPQAFEIRYVPCMRLCGKGPNIRWDGKRFHNADEALLRRLLKGRLD